jgi:hypothetical protein
MARFNALALLIGPVLACAALFCATPSCAAMAQTPAAPVTPAARILEDAAATVDDQPIDTTQLALGQRWTKAIDLESFMGEGLDASVTTLRAKIWASLLAAMPDADKTQLAAALDETVAGYRADIMARQMTIFSRYFAISVAPAPLAEITTFAETPLGLKSIRTPEAMTDADRSALNRYAQAHPAVLDELPTRLVAMHLGLTVLMQEQDIRTQAFKVRLCRTVKAHGQDLPPCKALN